MTVKQPVRCQYQAGGFAKIQSAFVVLCSFLGTIQKFHVQTSSLKSLRDEIRAATNTKWQH
jgi:hypothetical protein